MRQHFEGEYNDKIHFFFSLLFRSTVIIYINRYSAIYNLQRW